MKKVMIKKDITFIGKYLNSIKYWIVKNSMKYWIMKNVINTHQKRKKILLSCTFQTDRKIKSEIRPDIAVKDYKRKMCLRNDMAVPTG